MAALIILISASVNMSEAAQPGASEVVEIDVQTQDVAAPSRAAAVTYPYGVVSTLTPDIVWTGGPQDAYQAVIEVKNGPPWRWDSGTVESREFRITSPPLPPQRELTVRVRLRRNQTWSDWSAAQEFSTPASPQVRFLSPADVTALNDSRPTLIWDVSAAGDITQQTIRIDSNPPIKIPVDVRSYRTPRLETGLHTAVVRVTETGGATSEASVRFWVDAPPAHFGTVHIFDLRFLKSYSLEDPLERGLYYDTCHLLATLQGLVNKKGPRLYYKYFGTDQFWLDQLTDKDNGWFSTAKPESIEDLESLLSIFRDDFEGVVEFDPDVWATSNVASTIAGVENLLAIRKDTSPGSLYDRLVLKGPKLLVVKSLVEMFTGKGKIPGTDRDSTGSRKCDAYIWAKINYLDSGKCNPRKLAYWVDSFWLTKPYGVDPPEHLLFNHDYMIANRGFFFDLSSWGDETPVDDPDQPLGTDLATKKEILLSAYNAAGGKMIHAAGFTPWWLKYTKRGGGSHDGVATEWEWARLATSYNVFMDADATGISDMVNASLLSQYPLPDRLIQNPKPTLEDMRRLGYIDASGSVAPHNYLYFYMGDYDSAAWVQRRLLGIWNDRGRGLTPMGWAINPNLIDRNALAFDYYYRTKSDLDFFIAGDSGAGYVNPRNLLSPRNPSGLPSGAAEWIAHCEPYYRRLDYSITGFLLNGVAGKSTPETEMMYLSFSVDGVMTQSPWMHGPSHLLHNMPVAEQKGDLSGDLERMASRVHRSASGDGRDFLSFRTILMSPSTIKGVVDTLRMQEPGTSYVPLEPYTYFYLLRHHLGGKNERRATYTFDTMPKIATAGERIKLQIGVRNDGWETWQSGGSNATVLAVSLSKDGGRDGAKIVPIPRDIGPGEGEILSLEIDIPAEGDYELMYQMRTGESGWFEDARNLPWRIRITSLP